jgi:hypothetical protein
MDEFYRPRSECVSVVCWPKSRLSSTTEAPHSRRRPSPEIADEQFGDLVSDPPPALDFNGAAAWNPFRVRITPEDQNGDGFHLVRFHGSIKSHPYFVMALSGPGVETGRQRHDPFGGEGRAWESCHTAIRHYLQLAITGNHSVWHLPS